MTHKQFMKLLELLIGAAVIFGTIATLLLLGVVD